MISDVTAVARGETPADLAVLGGRVLRPETRTFVDRDLLVAGDTIAAQVEDATDHIDADTTIVDASDRTVVPGFIDAHTHLDIHVTLESAYPTHLEGGTTTFVTEVAATGATFDTNAVRELLDATAELPITVRALLPMAPLLGVFEPPRIDDASDYLTCLDRHDVLGVGELSWPYVVDPDGGVLEAVYDAATARGTIVGAHGAGCRGVNLQALSHRATDDHEAITGDGHLERAAAGIHPIGRSGTIRDDAPAVADALEGGLDPSELSLSTDGAWPRTLHREGSMDGALRRVIDAGADPEDALLTATRTPARHFGLSRKGSLAPGNDADIVVLDNLATVDVTTTIAGGELVYDDHSLAVSPQTHDYPSRFTDSVQFDLPEDALTVSERVAVDARVEAITYNSGILTDATTVEPDSRDGELHASPAEDVLKTVLVDRHPRTDRGHFTGFIEGIGLEEGALATTVGWESATALGIGANDADLRRALDAVRESGGGWALVHNGDLVASILTPVAGCCSTRPVPAVVALEDDFRDALRGLGVTPERPLLAIQTLTFVGVPGRKLTCSGYADVRSQSLVGLTPT